MTYDTMPAYSRISRDGCLSATTGEEALAVSVPFDGCADTFSTGNRAR